MTLDGSANAPSGTAQLPSLLNGYAIRPSWNVAGVDYAVGVPSGTALKDPSTISMAGVSVDTNNHVVTITGNNVTFNGYDFSLNGGWEVYVASGSNATIENCNFSVGANHQQPIYVDTPASNVTIKNNIINGAGLKNAYIGYGLIDASGTGTTTIEYNLIENAYSEDIVYDSQSGTNNSLVLQHNLITNAGMGVSAGAHGDWIQLYAGSGSAISDVQINYNTWVQNIPASQAITQGLSLQSANIAQGPVLSESVTNNTMAISAPGTVTYAIIADQTNLNGTATVSNNYIDPTGIQYGWSAFGSFAGPGQPGTGPYNGSLTAFNNVNMKTGAYYPQSGTSPPPDPATDPPAGSTTTAPPAAPVITTGVANSNESVTLTGTAPAGSTVTVSDGGSTPLGTATASSSGAWTFTTAALAADSYAFTATDSTSAGTSAASNAVDVTVTSSSSSTGSSPPPSGSNLVGNGNFETGTFSNWTVGGNSGLTPVGRQIDIETNGQGGSTYAAKIGSMGADGTLSQTITTTPGQTYTLSFWLQNEASGTQDNDFNATWNGQTLLSLTNAANSGYTQHTYTVTATGSTSTLEFSAANVPSQWDLDNISLTPAGSTTTDPPAGSTTTAPPAAPGSNLVGNGNFETGTFSNWTVGGNSGLTPAGRQIDIETNGQGGSTYAAKIGSMGADGTLSQTITTTPGQTYTLSFWLQNEASGTQDNDFNATWNGQTLLSLTNAANSGYTQHTYTVTATGSTSTLEFSAANVPSQWDLDNISLTPAGSTTTSPPAAPVISSATDTTSAGTSAVPNMALLVNHMASSFATTGHDQGGTTGIAQTANPAQQPLLSTPHH